MGAPIKANAFFLDYQIISLVGQGTGGSIYKVLKDGKEFALKIISTSGLQKFDAERFSRETTVAARFDNPHLLKTYNFGIHEGTPYIVMEFVDGSDLRSVIATKKFSSAEVCELGISVASALGAVHSMRVIHRDIKPENVLVDKNQKVKLIDFGLAGDTDELNEQVDSSTIGSGIYASPEQMKFREGLVDERSDLYALGILLFEVCTGNPPALTKNLLELMNYYKAERIPIVSDVNPAVSPALSQIVNKLMQVDPAMRYQSSLGLVHDLKRVSEFDLVLLKGQTIQLGQNDIRGIGKTELVGRELELAIAVKNLNTALSGMGRGLLLEGEPGVGKSRLAKELMREARSKQKIVLGAKCSFQEKNSAFAAFRSLVENLLSQIQMQEHTEIGKRLKRNLAHCSRGFEHLLVTVNPEFLNYISEQNFTKSNLDAESLLTNYSVFLVELAKVENGIVFFIDDIQWADSNSIGLIRRIIEMTNDLPVLFLFTGRNDLESIKDINLFEQTVSSQRLVRYTLQPLSRQGCASIIKNHLGNLEVDKSLEDKLIEYSSGNPFLLIENLNRLASSGYLFIENFKWKVLEGNLKDLGLSDNVYELILRNLKSVPQGAFDILQKFSIYGSTSSSKNLSILTGNSVPSLEVFLEKGVTAGCLDRLENGFYQFTHDRVREALISTVNSETSKSIFMQFAKKRYESLDANASKITTSELNDLSRFILNMNFQNDLAFSVRSITLSGVRLNKEVSFKESSRIFGKLAPYIDQADIDSNLRFEFLCEYARALTESGHAEIAVGLLIKAQPHASNLKSLTLVKYLKIEALQSLGKAVAIWEIGHEIMKDHKIPVPTNPIILVLINIKLLIGFLRSKSQFQEPIISNWTSELEVKQMLSLVLNRTILNGIFSQTKKMPLLYILLQYHSCALSLGPSLDLIRAKGWIAGLLLGFGKRFAKFSDREMAYCEQIAKKLKTKQAMGLYEYFAAQVADRVGDIRGSEKIFINGIENYGNFLLSIDYTTMWLSLVIQYINRGYTTVALNCMDRYSARSVAENRVGTMQTYRCTQFLSFITLGRFDQAEKAFSDAKNGIVKFEPGFIYHQTHFLGLQIYRELEEPNSVPDLDEVIKKYLSYNYDFDQLSFYFVAIGHIRVRSIEAESDATKKKSKIKEFIIESRILKKRIKNLICRVHTLVFESAIYRYNRDEKNALKLLNQAMGLADERDTDYARYFIFKEKARLARDFQKPEQSDNFVRNAIEIAKKNNWESRLSKIKKEFLIEDIKPLSRLDEFKTNASNMKLIESLLKISMSASTQLDSQKQIDDSLDEIVSVMNAERSYLFLKSTELAELNFGGGRDANKQSIDAPVGYSTTVVNKVFSERKPLVVIGNDQMGELGSQSAVLHGLRSILAAPLNFKGECIGVLYVDSSISKCQFSENDMSTFSAIAVQIAISIENLRMLKNEVHKKELEKEMELTAKVQSMLFPRKTSFENEDFRFCGFSRSAVQCGGDWWWYDYRNGIFSVFVGDFTGHGAGPAMLTSYVSACFDFNMNNGKTIDFDSFLPELNRLLLNTTQGEFLLSSIAIEVDCNKMQIQVWNCASPGILVMRNQERAEYIGLASSFLGVEDFKYDKYVGPFAKSERIFIATDGLMEMRNSKGNEFGQSATRRLFETTRALDAEKSINLFVEKVDEFHTGKSQEDDITMVYLESKKSNSV